MCPMQPSVIVCVFFPGVCIVAYLESLERLVILVIISRYPFDPEDPVNLQSDDNSQISDGVFD